MFNKVKSTEEIVGDVAVACAVGLGLTSGYYPDQRWIIPAAIVCAVIWYFFD